MDTVMLDMRNYEGESRLLLVLPRARDHTASSLLYTVSRTRISLQENRDRGAKIVYLNSQGPSTMGLRNCPHRSRFLSPSIVLLSSIGLFRCASAFGSFSGKWCERLKLRDRQGGRRYGSTKG
eukprot:gene26534-biopygen3868